MTAILTKIIELQKVRIKTFSDQLRVISCSLLLCLLGLQDYGPNSKTPFRQVIHNLDLFANL